MSLPGAAEKDGSGSPSSTEGTDRSFPRSLRLTARKEFQAVYRRGRRVRSSSFNLFGLPNAHGRCRLGITVTKKIGGAVQRNRVKRMIRDVFRRHARELSPALDLVVHAHPGIVERTTQQVEREFIRRFAELAPGIER